MQYETPNRYATSSINITLPEAGEPESLSYDRTIEIDTTAPAVLNATSTQPNGTYATSAVIGVTVSFSSPVVVVNGGDYPANCTAGGSGDGDVAWCEGLPALQLDASGEHGDKNATYAGGNGTADLLFEYEARVLCSLQIREKGRRSNCVEFFACFPAGLPDSYKTTNTARKTMYQLCLFVGINLLVPCVQKYLQQSTYYTRSLLVCLLNNCQCHSTEAHAHVLSDPSPLHFLSHNNNGMHRPTPSIRTHATGASRRYRYTLHRLQRETDRADSITHPLPRCLQGSGTSFARALTLPPRPTSHCRRRAPREAWAGRRRSSWTRPRGTY